MLSFFYLDTTMNARRREKNKYQEESVFVLHVVKVCAHFEGLVYIAANQSVHMFLAFQGEVTGQHSGQGFPNSIWSAGDFGTLALSHACSNLFLN